jgi:hypothetical protein
MAAYNFQKRFAPMIESGAKRSTIRKRRANGYIPRPGDVLTLYYGLRTKHCKLIRKVAVTEVLPIVVHAGNGCVDVVLEGNRLTDAGVSALARSDGFKDVREFSAFFEHAYGPDLQAYLIRWADYPL